MAGVAFALPQAISPARPAALSHALPIQASQFGNSSGFSGISSFVMTAAAAATTISRVSLHAAKKKRGADKQDYTPPPPPPPFDPAGEIGAVAPFGYFDPLNLCPPGDKGKFRRFREAELKHGRAAMMASVGLLGQHYIKFPGFEAVPNGATATTVAPGSFGWLALLVLSGVMELYVWTGDSKKEAGDFGDPLGLNMYTEDMRNKEVNNGRFAMFATMGILTAELVTGKDSVEQLQDYFGKASLPGMPATPAVPVLPSP